MVPSVDLRPISSFDAFERAVKPIELPPPSPSTNANVGAVKGGRRIQHLGLTAPDKILTTNAYSTTLDSQVLKWDSVRFLPQC